MEQPCRLVGIEQRFGEELGVGHLSLPYTSMKPGKCPAYLTKSRNIGANAFDPADGAGVAHLLLFAHSGSPERLMLRHVEG